MPSSRVGTAAGFVAGGVTFLGVVLGIALASAPTAEASMVVTGWGGTALVSADGSSWVPQSTGTTLSYFATAPGWPSVSVGASGATLISGNGTTWQAGSVDTPQWLNGVARSGDTWIAVGTTGVILRRDGNGPWQEAVSPTTSDLHAIATDGERWMAVGAGGLVVTSDDGWAWTTGAAGSVTLRAVSHGNGLWVVAGDDGSILHSTDLSTWTPGASGTTAGLDGVAYGTGTWVAVGAGGTLLLSPDAAAWQAVPSGTSVDLADVAADCQGAWAAVGASGTIVTSPDGESWNPAATGTTQNLRGVSCTPAVPAALACTGLTTWPDTLATVQATGGTPPYAWSSIGGADNGTGFAYDVAFPAVGTYTVALTDSGVAPYGMQTASCDIIVVEPPSDAGGGDAGDGTAASGDAPGGNAAPPSGVACLPASQTVAKGGAAGFTADGAAAPYAWQAPGAVDSGAAGITGFAAVYDALGVFKVTVAASGGPAASCTVHVVDGLLVSAGGPYDATLGPGGASFTLMATISGGQPPYACAWTGTGLLENRHSCISGAIFGAEGEAVLLLMVTDANGLTATASATVRVHPAPDAGTAEGGLAPRSVEIVQGHGSRGGGAFACGAEPGCEVGHTLAAAPGPAPSAAQQVWPEPPTDIGSLIGIVAAGLGGLLAARYFLLRQGIFAAIVVLFSRLRGSDLSENPTRAFLLQRIAAEPGVHFRELVRASGMGRGTVQHHLGILIRAGILEQIELRGFAGYRFADAPWPDRLPASRALKAPMARRFMEVLQENGSLRVAELAQRCELTYGGAIYHLRRLSQAGLVEMVDAKGQERVVRLAQPQVPVGRQTPSNDGAA